MRQVFRCCLVDDCHTKNSNELKLSLVCFEDNYILGLLEYMIISVTVRSQEA